MATKPDCAVCGRPYHKHNVGSSVFCPIIATYRPATRPPASGVAEELRGALYELVTAVKPLKASGKRITHLHTPLGRAMERATAALATGDRG